MFKDPAKGILLLLIGKLDSLVDEMRDNNAILKDGLIGEERQARATKLIPKDWQSELLKLDNDSLDLFMDWWEAKPRNQRGQWQSVELWNVLFEVWRHYNPEEWEQIILNSKPVAMAQPLIPDWQEEASQKLAANFVK